MCSAFYFNNLVQLWNGSVEHFHMCNNNTYTVTREHTLTQFKIAEHEMLVFMKLEKLIRLCVKQLRQLIRTVCTLEEKQQKNDNSNTQSNEKSQTKQFKLEMPISSNSVVSWEQNLTQTAIYFSILCPPIFVHTSLLREISQQHPNEVETSNSTASGERNSRLRYSHFKFIQKKIHETQYLSINLQHKKSFRLDQFVSWHKCFQTNFCMCAIVSSANAVEQKSVIVSRGDIVEQTYTNTQIHTRC